MEPVIIHRRGGAQLVLPLTEPLAYITKAEQTRKLLGDDFVSMTVECVEAINFEIGDYVVVFGERYTINQLPNAKKGSELAFAYDIKFEGPQYTLLRALIFDLDSNGYATSSNFTLTGDLDLFAEVLMGNIKRVFPTGWELGTMQAGTPVKTLTFSDTNCLAAMQMICQEFDTEFDLVPLPGTAASHTLNFGKVGQLLGQIFEYGQGKGFYELQRSTIQDKDIVTRLYPSGASKNIPGSYRNYSPKLKIANDTGYIEKADAVQAFGVIEYAKTWEDIFPKRTGTITAIGGDGLTFSDAGMDFDLEAVSGPAIEGKKQYRYLLPGMSAKVQMQTGGLAGYGFEIRAYNHATKTFSVKTFKDDRETVFPNAAPFLFAPGDTYVLLDVLMPQTYVDQAEAELLNQAQAYLDGNCAPRVQYSLSVSEAYLQSRGVEGATTNFFSLGDLVKIRDTDLNIDKASRILSFTRDVLNPFLYRLEVSDSYEISILKRILAAQADIRTIIQINDLRDSKKALYGWKAGQELLSLVLDPDGYFDGTKIRPSTIETGMLSVGSKPQQLILNVLIEPNYNGQPNTVRVGAGSLTHYTIADPIPTWQIGAAITAFGDNAARYIYARCHRTNLSDALVIFSTQQIKTDQDATYYHFLLGVLHQVDTSLNVRYISLTYGATTINGRFIRTGRIQSADGQTYFDLDTGEIGGRIIFSGSQNGGGADVATLDAEIKFIQNFTIPNLRKSIAGKIISYNQDADPNTWSVSERPLHDGDMWYRTSTKRLFVYNKNANGWDEVTDPNAIAAYVALRGTEGKSTTFRVQPFTPYSEGDLWADGEVLRVCVQTRLTGNYIVTDWSLATKYDNTKTVIDGGIVTSGTIQLGGILGTIRAGITGVGNLLTSVRIWAGASFENRELAPFRVLDSGEVFARKRIELLNQNNVGQAGICGANTAADGPERIWAGGTYEDRAKALFRVLFDGTVYMLKGIIGKLTLSDGGLLADDGNGTSLQLDINRPDDSQGSYLTNLRSTSKAGTNTIQNTALYLEATGNFDTPTGQVRDSYALFAKAGKAMLNEGLFNGRAAKYFYHNANSTRLVGFDARRYDIIFLNPAAGRINIAIGITDIYPGKRLTLINLNNNSSECYITDSQVLDGVSEVRISGGEVLEIIFCPSNYWLATGRFDNNYPQTLNLPLTDVPIYQ